MLAPGWNLEDETQPYQRFNNWLFIEFGICFTTLITNILFLIIRSFCMQRIIIKVRGELYTDETDFIVSQHFVIGIIVTLCAPVFLHTIIHNSYYLDI